VLSGRKISSTWRNSFLIPKATVDAADLQARKALEVVNETYQPHGNAIASMYTIRADFPAALAVDGLKTPGGRGETNAAMREASEVIEAEYTLPILAYACLEPVSCAAEVTSEGCKMWLATQAPTTDAQHAATALGIDVAKVTVHNEFIGGAFGRRSGREHMAGAVLLAKAIRKPVKVVWCREEDILIDKYRTPALGRVLLGLDVAGSPVAYEAKFAASDMRENLFLEWFAQMNNTAEPKV
jgi:isoquinoline 1-oxidoreductase subunit beta